MQVSAERKTTVAFRPIELKLTLESQEDVDKLFAIFDNTEVLEPLNWQFGTEADVGTKVRAALDSYVNRTAGQKHMAALLESFAQYRSF